MLKIYVIKCYTKDKAFIKLGYTKNPIKIRFQNFKYKYRVIRVVKTKNAKEIEESIHRLIKNDRLYFADKFVGHTECYPLKCTRKINKLINQFCNIRPKKKKKTKLKTLPIEIMNNSGQLDYVDLSMFKF